MCLPTEGHQLSSQYSIQTWLSSHLDQEPRMWDISVYQGFPYFSKIKTKTLKKGPEMSRLLIFFCQDFISECCGWHSIVGPLLVAPLSMCTYYSSSRNAVLHFSVDNNILERFGWDVVHLYMYKLGKLIWDFKPW